MKNSLCKRALQFFFAFAAIKVAIADSKELGANNGDSEPWCSIVVPGAQFLFPSLGILKFIPQFKKPFIWVPVPRYMVVLAGWEYLRR